MEDKLLDDLVDSMVDELSESKLDLREFIINALDDKETIKKYHFALTKIKSHGTYKSTVTSEWCLTDMGKIAQKALEGK